MCRDAEQRHATRSPAATGEQRRERGVSMAGRCVAERHQVPGGGILRGQCLLKGTCVATV
jgi:hypothetical protein